MGNYVYLWYSYSYHVNDNSNVIAKDMASLVTILPLHLSPTLISCFVLVPCRNEPEKFQNCLGRIFDRCVYPFCEYAGMYHMTPFLETDVIHTSYSFGMVRRCRNILQFVYTDCIVLTMVER